MNYEDILTELRRFDEISLMELLELSSEDLVERFEDKIGEKLEQIREQLQEEANYAAQGVEDE